MPIRKRESILINVEKKNQKTSFGYNNFYIDNFIKYENFNNNKKYLPYLIFLIFYLDEPIIHINLDQFCN